MNRDEIKAQATIRKMISGDCTDYEMARFIISDYFVKGYMVSDFKDDLIAYNLTEEATESLLAKVNKALSETTIGSEITQKCKGCDTVFKITIIESDVPDPLGGGSGCPACGDDRVFSLEEF